MWAGGRVAGPWAGLWPGAAAAGCAGRRGKGSRRRVAVVDRGGWVRRRLRTVSKKLHGEVERRLALFFLIGLGHGIICRLASCRLRAQTSLLLACREEPRGCGVRMGREVSCRRAVARRGSSRRAGAVRRQGWTAGARAGERHAGLGERGWVGSCRSISGSNLSKRAHSSRAGPAPHLRSFLWCVLGTVPIFDRGRSPIECPRKLVVRLRVSTRKYWGRASGAASRIPRARACTTRQLWGAVLGALKELARKPKKKRARSLE